MEDRFTTNACQVRWLEVQRLMDKYTTAWRCSTCGKQFELTESERLAVESDEFDVPSRVRHQFENHKCDSVHGALANKRSTSALAQMDETKSA
jgi:hypothetical protein